MKALFILTLFPYQIFCQNYTLCSFNIDDSLVEEYYKCCGNVDNAIIQKLIVHDLKSYQLLDSTDCYFLSVLDTKSDRKIEGFGIAKNDLVEVHFIDYFSVNINEKSDKGMDMLSDSLRANPLTGQVTWIVNGRGLSSQYFKLSDISQIEFIYDDQNNSLIALSFKFKYPYLNLENAWFLAEEFKMIPELRMFYYQLLQYENGSTFIRKLEFCY